MRMNFEQLPRFVTGHDSGYPSHVGNGLANLLDIKFFAAQQEHHFVSKLFLNRHAPLLDPHLRRHHMRRACRDPSRSNLAPHIMPDSLQNHAQALAASIDHTSLFERGKQIGSASYRLPCRHNNLLHQCYEVITALGAHLRCFGGFAHHGQDGSLYGFEHGAIGETLSLLQRQGEIRGRNCLFLVESLRQSA